MYKMMKYFFCCYICAVLDVEIKPTFFFDMFCFSRGFHYLCFAKAKEYDFCICYR